MTAAVRRYQNFLDLLRIVIASSASALIPLTNYFTKYIPVAPERENLFIAFAIFSAGFAVPLIYSSREFLWEWQTNILALKDKQNELDLQFLNIRTSSEQAELVTDYRNLSNTIKRRYYSGGGVKLQLLSLALFLASMGGYGAYLQMSPPVYPLFLYCTSSGFLSGAFALVTLVIFGRPYRRYTLPEFT